MVSMRARCLIGTNHGKQTMFHTIEILGDQMCVMDEDGNGLDTVRLTGLRDATRQIQTWTSRYTISVAVAYRQIDDHFAPR